MVDVSHALEAALDRVGDRWSLLVVEALLEGPRRFNELGETLPGIAPNILTERLRRLERERIVTATPYQQRPPRMSYALTADGRDLASVLRLLADWGAGAGGARAPPARALRHGPRDPLVVSHVRGRRSRTRTSARPAPSSRTVAHTPCDRPWTTPAGSPGCRRSTARPCAPPALPPSLQGLPPRSVPEVAPTPLQRHYVMLSVPVLICGAIAITALEWARRSAARWSSCAC